ncbi:LysM peptidoglycan-binding domain-containing protein [Sporolactobacillus shoreae]|uniref:LysM peptidoglycan-binding domain-containing protein n=1 Tax=Sporolactobacillus shoreae TaxID=1465501 RepID=UPI0014332459|nr:LysM domain-containing protein [Sporolactobacillus shoreae]
MKLYVVQKGDSVAAIAQKHEMAINDFRDMNNGLTDEELIQGMKVKVSGNVQPLKVERSEKPKKQAQVQPSVTAPIQTQKPAASPSPQVEAAKKPPAVSGAQEKAKESPATGGHPTGGATDFNTIFYPKVSQNQYQYPGVTAGAFQNVPGSLPSQSAPMGSGYPNYPGLTGNIGGAVNSAVSPYGINPYSPAYSGNPGTAVSPAAQSGQMSPYSQPYPPYSNPGNLVSPAMQPNQASPYSPASAGKMGNAYSPISQPAAVNPYSALYPGNPSGTVSPVTQSVPTNPYYQAPITPQVSPVGITNPAMQSGASNKKSMPMIAPEYQNPVSGKTAKASMNPTKQAAYSPLSKGAIQPAADYQLPNAAQAPVSPWIQPGQPSVANVGTSVQNAANPLVQGQQSIPTQPAGQGTIGGYPYPYMPPMGQQRPCGCGGPSAQPYSPFATSPTYGYYGGNLPQAEMPYSEMGSIPAPVFQLEKPIKPTSKK